MMKKLTVLFLFLTMTLCGLGGEMLLWRVTDTTRRVVQEYVQETSKDSDGNIIYITNEDGTPKMIWRDKTDENGHPVYEVTGHAYVDGERLSSFVSPYAWSEDGYSGFDVGARVKVVFGDGTSEILPIKDAPVINGVAINYAEIGDGTTDGGTGIVGTGDWGLQSQLPESELLQEAMFLIELGELTYDEVMDNYMFTKLLAESDPYSYRQLQNLYIYEISSIAPPTQDQWTPMNFHRPTPEPSSALLCIIGFGMLMLRRKTPKWENG